MKPKNRTVIIAASPDKRLRHKEAMHAVFYLQHNNTANLPTVLLGKLL